MPAKVGAATKNEITHVSDHVSEQFTGETGAKEMLGLWWARSHLYHIPLTLLLNLDLVAGHKDRLG